MKIGIIRETKSPPDQRVVLTPAQCAWIKREYPQVDIYVQKSDNRCFSDHEYEEKGLFISDSLENCDVMLGVKEVDKALLLSDKTYLFFSHTIKKQAYNKALLQAILKKNIRLIDYECIRGLDGKRLIGFGRFAGIVGTYNAFLTYGKFHQTFDLPMAFELKSQENLVKAIKTKELGAIRVVLTGDGRVAHGAREMLEDLNFQEVSPDDFISIKHSYPVFTNVLSQHYLRNKSGSLFDKKEYYAAPDKYESVLGQYVNVADLLITGHVWKKGDPLLLPLEFFQSENNLCKVVADVTCDLNGPIACTIKPSVIGTPYYLFDPISAKETKTRDGYTVAVMSVDNLPCELPKDASQSFGQEFITYVLPELLQTGTSEILSRATICERGALTIGYQYLDDFVKEESIG